MMDVLMAHDASVFSADSPVGCRGQFRRAVLEGTSRAFWQLRRYEGWTEFVTSGHVLRLLILVLASWRPPISDFLSRAGRGLELVGAVYGFRHFEGFFTGKHGSTHLPQRPPTGVKLRQNRNFPYHSKSDSSAPALKLANP